MSKTKHPEFLWFNKNMHKKRFDMALQEYLYISFEALKCIISFLIRPT